MEFLIHDKGHYYHFNEAEAKGYAQTCGKNVICEIRENDEFLERLKLLDIFNKRRRMYKCTLDEMKEIYSYYLIAKNKGLKGIGKVLGFSIHNVSKAISEGLRNGWNEHPFKQFMTQNKGYYFLDKKANKEVAKWEIFNTFKGKELEDVYNGFQIRYERKLK